MANDFRSARFWAAEIIDGALTEGSVAVDATLGNGHDAQHLCELVGESGRVYGFDIQQEAVDRSFARLKEAGLEARATLICDGHQNMENHIDAGSVDAVLFNLGWLPGAAHNVTTLTETTLKAVDAALNLLKDGGVMTVCIYPGHEEGARERDALIEKLSALDEKRYDIMLRCYLNQKNAPPLMIAVKKNLRRAQKTK